MRATERMRIWRWMKWSLIVLVALALFFVFGVAPYLVARGITGLGTRPMDRAITLTPASYDVPFQEVSFPSLDNIRISGWYMPGQASHVTIIYCHGLFRSRQEMLSRAASFWKRGYGGLLLDFRNHGKSDQSINTLGYKERLDVRGAVKFLHEELGVTDRLAVLGVSMGAAAALLAAAEDKEIEAIISDSSFLSLQETVIRHLKLLLGLPRFPISDELIFFITRRGDFKAEDFDLLRAVRLIGDRPIMFISGGADRRVPPECARQLYEASPSTNKRLIIVPDARHGAAFRADPLLYEEQVVRFLASAFGRQDQPLPQSREGTKAKP